MALSRSSVPSGYEPRDVLYPPLGSSSCPSLHVGAPTALKRKRADRDPSRRRSPVSSGQTPCPLRGKTCFARISRAWPLPRPPRRGSRPLRRPALANLQVLGVTPTAMSRPTSRREALLATSRARRRVGRRTWFADRRGRPRFPVPRLPGKPDAPRVHTWGRARLHVENGVAAPTRVHTITKGALMMVISTRVSISTDGYEESND